MSASNPNPITWETVLRLVELAREAGQAGGAYRRAWAVRYARVGNADVQAEEEIMSLIDTANRSERRLVEACIAAFGQAPDPDASTLVAERADGAS